MRWLDYAKNDLQAAEIIFARDDVAPRTACFLSQQSAEKALKAVMVCQGLNVLKTHDLDALIERMQVKPDSVLLELDLTWLTEWSVESRYPGDWPEATKDDAKKAIEIASSVVDTCKTLVKQLCEEKGP